VEALKDPPGIIFGLNWNWAKGRVWKRFGPDYSLGLREGLKRNCKFKIPKPELIYLGRVFQGG